MQIQFGLKFGYRFEQNWTRQVGELRAFTYKHRHQLMDSDSE